MHWLDIRYAWRMLQRDWHSGELRILALALVIAVSSVSAVGFFVDRVQKGMNQQATELLAADLVVSSSAPLAADIVTAAERFHLAVATTRAFRSVVMTDAAPQLVEVKAVSPAYPLRGELHITTDALAGERAVGSGPAAGEVWVEPRLLTLLNVAVDDELLLGSARLKISQVLVYEPDRGGDMFSIAPRVLMHDADVTATRLIQHGSLVAYRLLLAGQNQDIKAFRRWFEQQAFEGLRLLTAREGRPELRTAVERAQRFLGLAALISVLLAGVAIATATRRFSHRHLDTSAILRCFGATQTRIIRLFMAEFLLLALVASTVGCLLGYFSQFAISQLLDRMLLVQLPVAGWRPLVSGYATGIILLLGFALPPLLALKQVSPLRVLRRDLGVTPTRSWLVYAAVLLSMAVLMYWQTGELILVLWMVSGLLATLSILAVCAYGMVLLLGYVRRRATLSWRFGLANITRRPAASVVQVVALGIGLMVLLLLSIVRTDLLEGWSDSLPDKAPNHFLINVQKDQVTAMQTFLHDHGVDAARLYPMVKARLRRINEHEVSHEDYANSRAQHLVAREFNLSWATDKQMDNRITAGRWWSASDYGQRLISLETGLAETLGIKLDDTMSFAINGDEQTFRVSNLREVDWDSFNINFFTLVPPGVLEQQPSSWVTSVYLSAEQKQYLAALVRAFPNVTVIDIATIMNRVRQVMDRVALAVEFIFFFTLLAGVVVLFAAIQANQDERRYESAILRTLGAQRKTLLRGLIAEFVLLGAVAGVLAGVAATGLAYVLAAQVFHFSYHFNPVIILAGLLAGIVIVGIAGVLGTRSALNQAPLVTLRAG
jgi:putative ABC transport system permease protein